MDKTLKTIFVLIILFFGGVALMNIKNTPEEFEYAEVNYEPRECIDSCPKCLDWPGCPEPRILPVDNSDDEELAKVRAELTAQQDTINLLTTELNQWKTDFDKNSLYTMCLKHKRFCKYFNQAL